MNDATNTVSSFQFGPVEQVTRVMLKDKLGLTGSEISVNRVPAGQSTPFVHAHKKNEEVYIFVAGQGKFWLDGEILTVGAGQAVRVAPPVGRCLKASDTENLCYYCIQAQAHSLTQATREDGILLDVKVAW